ncbi:MAG: VOC family protein [Leadbetterella sp.]
MINPKIKKTSKKEFFPLRPSITPTIYAHKHIFQAESKEEADHLFNGLSVEGQIEMPLEESPDGGSFGMFRDKFGFEWMVEFVGK